MPANKYQSYSKILQKQFASDKERIAAERAWKEERRALAERTETFMAAVVESDPKAPEPVDLTKKRGPGMPKRTRGAHKPYKRKPGVKPAVRKAEVSATQPVAADASAKTAKVDPKELAERQTEARAKSDEQSAEALRNLGYGNTNNVLPDNWLGLRSFYNLMFMDRGYKLPMHMELPVYALADKRIDKLLITIGPGSTKSTLLSTIFPAHTLGQRPSTTILGISAGENLMQGFQLAIMGWVEHSPMWKQLFPNVQPNKDKGWSTERGMFVTGHREGDPDASFFATGISSKSLTGKHGRLIICDDIHDKENAATADACLKIRETYYNTVIGRADPEGARFIFAGRRWHEEDLYGHLKSTGEWVVMELPAIRDGAEDLYWDVTLPQGMQCCFTDGSIGAKIS